MRRNIVPPYCSGSQYIECGARGKIVSPAFWTQCMCYGPFACTVPLFIPEDDVNSAIYMLVLPRFCMTSNRSVRFSGYGRGY